MKIEEYFDIFVSLKKKKRDNVENVISMDLDSDNKNNKCSCENVVLAGKNGGSFDNVKPVYEDNQQTYESALPMQTKVRGNYPNPFNPSTTIAFDLAQEGLVSIVIYDIQGRKVVVLQNELQTPGYYAIQWDAAQYSSGVYFIEMVSSNYKEVRKIIYMK